MTESCSRMEERAQLERELRALEREGKSRRHIGVKKQIMPLRCPRCHAAFVDYEGCAALSCRSCPCTFCTLCLEDCSDNADEHAARCRSNPERAVDADADELQRVQRERRAPACESSLPDSRRTCTPLSRPTQVWRKP